MTAGLGLAALLALSLLARAALLGALLAASALELIGLGLLAYATVTARERRRRRPGRSFHNHPKESGDGDGDEADKPARRK